MFLTRSEYDRGVNTFSPEGRLLQIEYAIEAVKLGTTAIGIQAKDGIVLAVEKRVQSPLMVTTVSDKLVEIDHHVGCASSGLIADARMLVERAQVVASNHKFLYKEDMPVESITQAVSNRAIQFGDADSDNQLMSRPYGVAFLFAGYDAHCGFQLFHMDPSGTYVQYKGKAIGSGCEGAQQSLEEAYHESITLTESIKITLNILKQVMEDKLTASNIEVATVTKEGFHMFNKAELEALLV